MNNNSFSIMTFNIKFGLAPDKNNAWKDRKKLIFKLIKKSNPDFIALQEVNNFQLQDFRNNLHDYNDIGEYNPLDPYWQNTPIFFKEKYKNLYAEHFFLSHTPNIKSRFKESIWPRQAVCGLFNIRDKFIAVINTHMDFKDKVQKKSALLIKEKMAMFNRHLPKILCGDFNSDPTGICYHEFTSLNTSKPHFKDPFRSYHNPTFHGFTGIPSIGRIDWILYNGNIKPISKKIIKTSENKKYPSDHFPVIAQFKFT